MIKVVASIQAECERLGLEEDARVLKAWLSHNVPHLSEETEILEEIYDLYTNISTLPPVAVPSATLSLKTLPYHTTGKNVRQIMGELGYLIYSIYQQGYRQHDITDMPDATRASHIQLGAIIQDLIVLFGIYYNASNRRADVLAAESEQMFSLWNTHIGSLVTKLAESLIRVKEHAVEMLATEGAKRFLVDSEDLRKQTQKFFHDIDEIILEIRRSFYQKSQLTITEIASIQDLLKKLRDFLVSLKAISSSLDLESGRYDPQALMYWSIVFSKQKEGHKSGRQKRLEITYELSEKPYLGQYAVGLESSSKLFQATANDINKAHKDFRAALKTLITLNSKVKESLIEALSFKRTVANLIPAFTSLEAAKIAVITANPDRKFKPEEFTSLVQKALEEKATPELQIFKTNISAILSAFLVVYPKRAIRPEAPDLAKFEVDKARDSLKELSRILDEAIKDMYTLWRGDFKIDPINELHANVFRIASDFSKIGENPLGQLHDYEKGIAEVLQIGKIFKDDGTYSQGFNEIAESLLQTQFYSSKSGDEEVKKADIARKIDDFNALLRALLTDTEAPEDLDLRGLQSFVEAVVREVSQRQFEEESPGEAERRSVQTLPSLETAIAYLPVSDSNNNIEDWLRDSVIVKAEINKLVDLSKLKTRDIATVSSKSPSDLKEAFLHKRILTAAEGDFTLGITREGASGTEEGFVKFKVDSASNQLTSLLYIKGPSGKYVSVGVPQSRALCAEDDIVKSLNDILDTIKVDSKENLTAQKDKIQTWYSEQLHKLEEAKGPVATTSAPSIPEPEVIPRPKPHITLAPAGKGPEVVDKKDKAGKAVRLETMSDYAITLNPGIVPAANNSAYESFFGTRVKTLKAYDTRTMEMVKQNYAYLTKVIIQASSTLLDSEGLLPTFPRIVFNAYARTSAASDAWKDWKTAKIEVPLHEIQTLINNLVATEKMRGELAENPRENLQGIPLVTIDRIDEKFEELIKLVRR